MSSAGNNPLSSPYGAVGDLGLSASAKEDASEMAEKMRKKKLAEQKAMSAAGIAAGNPVGAAQSLLGGV